MTATVLSLNIALPSEFVHEATAGTASDWLVIQKSGEAYVSRIAATATALGGAALAGSLSQGFSAAHLKLPTAGQVGFWDGAAWSSRIDFTSGYATLYSPMVEIRNLADSAYSDLTGRYLYADEYRSRAYPTTGIHYPATNTLTFKTNGGNRCSFGASGHFIPSDNATYNLGSTVYYWNILYGTSATFTGNITCNALTETSDSRLKTDIEDSDLGTDFILGLRPVSFRWIIGGRDRTPADPDTPGSFDTHIDRPGVRRHYGLLAEEVRDKAAEKKVEFGGYVYDPDENKHGLRYSQFIAPLVKAFQEEHAARLALEERVATLEKLIKRVE